jgi:hypothetical protein
MFSMPFRERRPIQREMLMLRIPPKTARADVHSHVPDNRAKMSRLTTAILLFLLMLSSPAARAGPTWMAEVIDAPDFSSGGPPGMTNIYVLPFTGAGSGVSTYDSGRGVPPTMFGVLLDYQGSPTPPINLYVTDASWGFNTSILDPVPLLVYSFPPSPYPPSSITSLPYGPSETLEIPVGDYSSSPCLITLPGPCVLLFAGFDHTLGPSYVGFTFSPSSVPEPSSWLILGTAMAGLAIFSRHESNRRRASSRRCAREPALDAPARPPVTTRSCF